MRTFIIISVLLAAGAAHADTVQLPWGDWLVLLLNQIAPIVIAAVVAAVAWICRKLPTVLASVVRENLTQAKIERAVNYGVAKASGAVKGQAFTADHVDVTLAHAVEYGKMFFPTLMSELGERFRPLAVAKLSSMTPIEGVTHSAAPLPAAPLQDFVKVPK